MRPVSTFVPFPKLFLLSLVLVCSSALPAQQRTPLPQPSTGNMPTPAPARTFSVNGMVTDAASHARLDLVRVELHSTSGAAIQTTFTQDNGRFEFDNIGSGDYTLVVDHGGYQSVSQRLEVFDSSVFGVQIDLVKTPDPKAEANQSPSTVSVRELSIPPKAHEDMLKGMALLYEKSDYQGSLKAFQKAIQEYPGYYEAYTQTGIAYMNLADAANAEKAFRKSIELSDDHYAVAYVGLAELCLTQHRFADAESPARKAVAIDANSWQANSELARTLVDLQRPAEAEKNALAAVKLKPDDAALYLILANTHIGLHNDSALLDDLNHYLKLAPDGPFAKQAREQRDQLQSSAAASPPPQP